MNVFALCFELLCKSIWLLRIIICGGRTFFSLFFLSRLSFYSAAAPMRIRFPPTNLPAFQLKWFWVSSAINATIDSVFDHRTESEFVECTVNSSTATTCCSCEIGFLWLWHVVLRFEFEIKLQKDFNCLNLCFVKY